MAEIEIRPAISSDLPVLFKIDHTVETTHVWQMDTNSDQAEIEIRFREIRLPRGVRLEYPQNVQELADTWTRKNLFLVAALQGQPIAYLTIEIGQSKAARVTDLVVGERNRRQGIASAMLLAAGDWAAQQKIKRMVLEVQAKNHAAIQLARKLGYEFCGYCDDYFANHDIAVFFMVSLK
ncbi:MAG: N-acetyltransferase family protein [Anaerolineaceae bacterium]